MDQKRCLGSGVPHFSSLDWHPRALGVPRWGGQAVVECLWTSGGQLWELRSIRKELAVEQVGPWES